MTYNACILVPAARLARVFPELFSLRNLEGAGNAGRSTHPQPCVRMKKHASKSPQARRKRSGIPCAMVLTTYSTLSPAIGLFVTVAGAMREHCRQLDISVEIPGPHGFAVRLIMRSSGADQRPPLPCPTFSDDRETSLYGHGTRGKMALICPTPQANCPATNQHDGQISWWAHECRQAESSLVPDATQPAALLR